MELSFQIRFLHAFTGFIIFYLLSEFYYTLFSFPSHHIRIHPAWVWFLQLAHSQLITRPKILMTRPTDHSIVACQHKTRRSCPIPERPTLFQLVFKDNILLKRSSFLLWSIGILSSLPIPIRFFSKYYKPKCKIDSLYLNESVAVFLFLCLRFPSDLPKLLVPKILSNS